MRSASNRVAVFMDYENLISTLKHKSQKGNGDFGVSSSINFEAFANHISANFGSLEKSDFIVAANFAHYNQQLGGLNRIATLIDVDSFEARQVRKTEQHSSGKKFVVKDYADMALAFYAGVHAATRLADQYIFVSGDKAFSAVATAIKTTYKRPVHFIFPDEAKAGIILKEKFLYSSFSESQPVKRKVDATRETMTSLSAAEKKESKKPSTKVRDMVSMLRQKFTTAIPTDLMRALLSPSKAKRLLDWARSEEKIDLYTNDSGVECVALFEERLYGKVVKMESRPTFLAASQILLAIATIAEQSIKPTSRAEWRKSLKNQMSISNSESKKWLELLLNKNILRDEQIQQPVLEINNVIDFLHTAETTFTQKD